MIVWGRLESKTASISAARHARIAVGSRSTAGDEHHQHNSRDGEHQHFEQPAIHSVITGLSLCACPRHTANKTI
jgi:hypothetical protein